MCMDGVIVGEVDGLQTSARRSTDHIHSLRAVAEGGLSPIRDNPRGGRHRRRAHRHVGHVRPACHPDEWAALAVRTNATSERWLPRFWLD